MHAMLLAQILDSLQLNQIRKVPMKYDMHRYEGPDSGQSTVDTQDAVEL